MRTSRFCLFMSFFFIFSCGGEPGGVGEQPTPGDAGGTGDVASLLPANDAVSGWRRSGELRFFGPDNLWEFIDGAAEGYLQYGFEEVVTADFAKEGQQAVIDIYRMKDPLHAFGIYGQERGPDYEFLDIGEEGYAGGTALNFWKGPYYVKATVFEESPELRAEMVELAKSIAGKMGEASALPAEMALFPEKNQRAHALRFIPQDVLGQSYLANGFEAEYREGERDYKMVVISMRDSDASREAFGRYRQFLSRSGPSVGDLGLGEEGFAAEDSFYGRVLACRSGSRILTVLGATEDVARAGLAEMLSRLKANTK